MRKNLDKHALGVARRQPVQSLLEATFDPALYDALEAYVGSALTDAAVLIGTLATNFYAKPRYATEAEFFVNVLPVDLPDAFECQEGGIAIHVPSGARMQFLTPSMMDLPEDIAAKIFVTATPRDGLMVASREAIVALNLIQADDPRAHHQCFANVVSVLEHANFDLDGWCLDEGLLKPLMQCWAATVSPT